MGYFTVGISREDPKEVCSQPIPPWRLGVAKGQHRFITIKTQPHIIFAIMQELDLNRRSAYFTVIKPNQRARRIGGDANGSFNATAKES